MPGSKASMAVQKKHIPPSQGPLSTRTIESQRKRNASEKAGGESSLLMLSLKEDLHAQNKPFLEAKHES